MHAVAVSASLTAASSLARSTITARALDTQARLSVALSVTAPSMACTPG